LEIFSVTQKDQEESTQLENWKKIASKWFSLSSDPESDDLLFKTFIEKVTF